MNKKIIIIVTLAVVTLSLHTHNRNHLSSQQHNLNGQLCKKMGGYVCGFVNKDCCSKGCQSNFFGLNQVCVDEKYLEMNVPACQKVCEQKSGIVYNDKLLSDIRCCQKTQFKDGICPVNGQIDLGVCNQDTLADRLIGLVSK